MNKLMGFVPILICWLYYSPQKVDKTYVCRHSEFYKYLTEDTKITMILYNAYEYLISPTVGRAVPCPEAGYMLPRFWVTSDSSLTLGWPGLLVSWLIHSGLELSQLFFLSQGILYSCGNHTVLGLVQGFAIPFNQLIDKIEMQHRVQLTYIHHVTIIFFWITQTFKNTKW